MRGLSTLSKTYSDMGKWTGNCKQRYVDRPRYRSGLTCTINGNGHSSEQCKVLNEVGIRHYISRTFKEYSQDPTATKKHRKNHEVNVIVQHAVDYIIVKEYENKKLSAKLEPYEYEKTNSEIDKKYFYELDKFILYGSHKEWRKGAFEINLENIYDMKILNDMNCIHYSKVKSLSEYNLLHDILNTSKLTTNINTHY